MFRLLKNAVCLMVLDPKPAASTFKCYLYYILWQRRSSKAGYLVLQRPVVQ